MKTTNVLLLLLFLAAFSFAQFPEPAPSWSKYAPLNEEFSVETPTTLGVRGDDKNTSSRKYYGSIAGTYVYIFSDPIRAPYFLSTINRYLADWKQTALTADTTAKRILFEDTYGYTHQILVVRTDARVYVAQAVARSGKDDISSRFVDSFAIGDNRLPVAEKPDQPNETSGGVVVPYSGDITGSEKGGGIGTGSGYKTPAPPPMPKEEIKPFAGQTSSLKLISRPRAGYTDLARFYEINGIVRLRVTFSGKGEIGPVSVVSPLPFGLTEQAISAARRITFEPEYRKGKGLDVVKAVEYSFSIY